jgi:hypothetical protein
VLSSKVVLMQSLYWCLVKEAWSGSLPKYRAAMKTAEVLQSAWDLQQLERPAMADVSIMCTGDIPEPHTYTHKGT